MNLDKDNVENHCPYLIIVFKCSKRIQLFIIQTMDASVFLADIESIPLDGRSESYWPFV